MKGKKVATPQLGNTQDVACRSWLASQSLTFTTPGDVAVLPMQNPEIVQAFLQGQIDAAWTVEPWVSRLETEGKGKVLVEEKDSMTTVLVASARFLKDQPDMAKRFAKAHDELTAWLVANPADAQERVRAGLSALTHKAVAAEAVARA